MLKAIYKLGAITRLTYFLHKKAIPKLGWPEFIRFYLLVKYDDLLFAHILTFKDM